MALPNDKITTTLVGDTLGSSSRDVGTLCTHPNINKWSKWKPVRRNKVTGLVESDLESVNYGLKTPIFSSDYEAAVNIDWEYLKPRGGNNVPSEPYRIGDFRNYEHNATAPIINVLDVEVNLFNQSNIFFMPMLNISTETTIGLEDLDLSNHYFGVILSNDVQAYLKTDTVPINNGFPDVTINTSEPLLNSEGELKIYYILTNTVVSEYTNVDSVPSVVYTSIPMDGDRIKTLTITADLGAVVNITHIGKTPTTATSSIEQYEPSTIMLWTSGKYYEVGDIVQYLDQIGSLDGIYRCISAHMSGTSFDVSKFVLVEDHFKTGGAVYLKLNLYNNSGTTKSIPYSGYTINANYTFFGRNSNYFQAFAYDGSGNPLLSHISIPSGGNADMIIGVPHLMNRNGTSVGTPPSGIKTPSNINVRLNGILITNKNLQFESE